MISVTLPDGRTIMVNTDDPEVAQKAAATFHGNHTHVEAADTPLNTFGGLVGNAVNAVIPGAADAYMGVDHIVRNAANAAIGNEKFNPSAAYRHGREFQESRDKHASENHGLLNALASTAGAVGGFFLPAAKVGTGARLGAKALAAAKTGAGYGALSAALRTNGGNPADVVSQTAAGALTGAGVAAGAGSLMHGAERYIAPVVGRALATPTGQRFVAQPAAAALRATANAVSHLPMGYGDRAASGLQGLAHSISDDGVQSATNRLVDASLRTGAHTPSSVRAEVARRQAMGTPATAADVSETARRQFASGLRTNGPATQAVRDAIDRRQERSGGRLADAVRRELGPTYNILEQGAAIRQGAQDAARPHYEEAYAAPGASDERLQQIMANPSRAMRGSLEQARELARIEERDPNTVGIDISPITNELEVTRTPSWETVDLVRRGIRSHADNNRDLHGNYTNEGRLINGLGGRLMDRARLVNPAYGRAVDTFGGEIAGRDALFAGRDSLKDGAEDIANAISGNSQWENQNFAIGNRSAMASDLSNFGRNTPYGNAGARLRTNYGEADGETYRALAGIHGEAPLGRLADVGRAEHEAHQTYKASRGNSATAERLADDAPLPTGVLSTALAALSGHPGATLKGAVGLLNEGMRNPNSYEAAKAGATNVLGSDDLATLDAAIRGATRTRRLGRLADRNSANRLGRLASMAGAQIAGALASQNTDPDADLNPL